MRFSQLAALACTALLAPVGSSCAEQPVDAVTFACSGGKSILAVFDDDGNVALILSDGREVSLPGAMSASGNRYSAPDESMEFWSKGDTAFIVEAAQEDPTYADCVEVPQPGE